jgi:hypothetical protein
MSKTFSERVVRTHRVWKVASGQIAYGEFVGKSCRSVSFEVASPSVGSLKGIHLNPQLRVIVLVP